MRGVKKIKDEVDLSDGGLDAGLAIFSAVTGRGQERTLEEIAFVCGVNKQDIWHIENRAKKKIKAEFERRGLNVGFEELL